MSAAYAAAADPYCYPGTLILRNLPGLTSQVALDRFEAVATGRRFLEPMPAGRWGTRHYRAIHRHIFQDVYTWAGKDRTVRISKGDNTFCYPERIDIELRRIFALLKEEDFFRGLGPSEFAGKMAHVLSELNAVHPFRDGNGRTQLAFVALFSKNVGYPLKLHRLDPSIFLDAMIESFRGKEGPLAEQMSHLIR